ncbi:MAG: hypothetical protein IPM17_08945 [Verrucomicrobia bacterium]|nr:hypothetical protein [Verrucomicrobiota bacterium]
MSAWWRRVLPKKLLAWREPREFRRLLCLSRARTRSKWYRLRWVSLCFALFLLPMLGRWIVGGDAQGWRLVIEALMLFAVAWCLVYGVIPWLERRPCDVSVFETGISRRQGNTARFWRFTEIEQCSWLHRADFSVLMLSLRSGRAVFLGVPAGETVAKTDALLRERGLVPRVDGAWPADHFPGAANK